VGRLLRFGPRGKKRKNTGGLGCKGEMGEGDLFCFFSIPFISFSSFYSKTFSKILDKLLTTQSIQNPCIQHDAQTLGFSKLINYHCIYLKANLIIQIH
jgi:hypothetical protein